LQQINVKLREKERKKQDLENKHSESCNREVKLKLQLQLQLECSTFHFMFRFLWVVVFCWTALFLHVRRTFGGYRQRNSYYNLSFIMFFFFSSLTSLFIFFENCYWVRQHIITKQRESWFGIIMEIVESIFGGIHAKSVNGILC
jgi:hypothetical protein